MRYLGYILACTGLLWAYTSSSYADQSCEDRATELNDRFGARYITLESECYPAAKEPVISSDDTFTLSPECQEKYDALNIEAAAEWDALYQACPDLPRPVPVDASPRDGQTGVGPTMRAPTKQELFDRVSSLKGKLKRAKSRQRRLARQCGR